MRRTAIILLVTILSLSWMAHLTTALTDTGITTDHDNVAITVADNKLHVIETITATNNGAENVTLLQFWIQSDANQDLTITATSTGTQLSYFPNGNIRECNLTEKHIAIPPKSSLDITITYTLPSSATRFIKDFLYNTSYASVSYNTQPLFSGKNIIQATHPYEIMVQLYNPSEAPLGLTTLIIIFLVVVIIITLLLLLLRRQRRKKRVGTVDTQETLATKKDLLLELLKELEKRYRSKTISDETYTKLKEEYKGQAVDSMRRLEDIKK